MSKGDYQRLKERGLLGSQTEPTWCRRQRIHTCCGSASGWRHQVGCRRIVNDRLVFQEKRLKRREGDYSLDDKPLDPRGCAKLIHALVKHAMCAYDNTTPEGLRKKANLIDILADQEVIIHFAEAYGFAIEKVIAGMHARADELRRMANDPNRRHFHSITT